MDHHKQKKRQNPTHKYKISEEHKAENKMEETWNFNPKHVNRDRRETTTAWPLKRMDRIKTT
jgi:hypothetical protein